MIKKLSPLLLLLLISVGTYGQQKTIKFDTYSLDDGLSQSSVTGIVQDKYGFIWISTQDGINRYDGYSFKTFKNNPVNANSIPNNYIHFLDKDAQGDLWFGTNRGIGKMKPKDYTVERISRPTFPNLNGYIFTALTFDKDGRLWALTEKNGINIINLKSKKIESITSVKGNSELSAIYIDDKDQLWVGTESGETYYSEYPYGKFKSIDYNSIFTIAPVNGFYNTAGGGLMVLTQKGLFSIDTDKRLQVYTEYTDIRYGSINCVYIEDENTTWVGTGAAGLFLIQQTEDGRQVISQYQNNALDNSSIADNDISCIYEDESGVFWIGTEQGVSKFDKYKQGFTTIS